MAFLFRKYQPEKSDISQDESVPVEPEVRHDLEFKLFPPSPKAQIYLIVAAVMLLNLILLAIVAIGIWMNLR
jgi:hypothetical protein